MSAPAAKDVRAAGVVAFRPGRRVLLVHRPKYDDWSFPKGKLDRGEHATAAAVREVAEETGLHVRLCLPLRDQGYPVEVGHKTVHYWTGRVVGDDDVSGYRPNAEIDGVRWVAADDAVDLLTYDHDRETLAEAVKRRRRTQAVVVLRHGRARSRRAWRGDDAERPLLRAGELQAQRLVPLLAAYGVTRLVSSSSRRCRQTLEPFAATTGWDLETRRRLSEEGASPAGVRAVVDDALEAADAGRCVALCTHRPVLPEVFAALGLADPGLEAGEMLVAHLRKGLVVGTERHLVL
ncbi:NUDIX hydrolase [Nocardioides rubriscoriae]|uniref:NUDIX hydrolase n=1 Tax=Nocardioides rubriscoriae TaxID=642762 RepID=UPI0011DF43DD|nr:NUDIX hydrolase [Nocardioides rubriscoriae]